MKIILPPGYHEHVLPETTCFGSYPTRTLAQCEICGGWFWMREVDYGRQWVFLRWYHWRLRRVLREATTHTTEET